MSLDESKYPNKQNIGDHVRKSAKTYFSKVEKGDIGLITADKKSKSKKKKKPDAKKAFNFLKKKGGK